MTLYFSPKQVISLRDSNAPINIWQGAVRAGKTYISMWRFLKELAKGPKGEYIIIARTFDSFKRTLLPIISQLLGMEPRYYHGKRELHLFGKRVHVVGCDDEASEMKIRGPTFRGAYVDEVTIIPESSFKMLISRCAMGGARIFATTNPDSPYHWLMRDFLTNNADVATWKFTLEDNPELKPEEKDYLRRQYKGMWYQRFIEGLWVQAEGAIYDMYDEATMVIDYPGHRAQSYIVGIDYGTTNPCAFVLIGINPERYPNIWVEREYFYDSRAKQRQKTDAEYADDFQRFIEGLRIEGIYIDPSAASFKAELYKRGIEGVFDAENEVIDGIRYVAKLLCQGTLKICGACKEVRREMQSYVWDVKASKTGIERPIKENDHTLDALRYALYTHLFNRQLQGLSASEIDQLYRDARGGHPQLPSFFQDPVMSGYQI